MAVINYLSKGGKGGATQEELDQWAAVNTTLEDNIGTYDLLPIPLLSAYQLVIAEMPDVTVRVYNGNGTLIGQKTTPAIIGGNVTFLTTGIGTYTITAVDSLSTQLWTTTYEITKVGIYPVYIPDSDSGYAMNRYTPEQLHLALQNGYFSTMFPLASKYNFRQSGSVFNNYDLFVENIALVDGKEVAYMRSVNVPSSTYNINPQISILTSATATAFTNTYSNWGGYKYSAMRRRMMLVGEEVYSQATGIKPDGSTIADGIEFSNVKYTNSNTTSAVYSYDYQTDTLTPLTEFAYLNTYQAQFLKGYFTSVGAISEEVFNTGNYYTYATYKYTPATTYVSGTTYYGFYETLQENGIFYDAFNSLAPYMIRTQDYSSTGVSGNYNYVSETDDYVDIPSVEEITGTSYNKRLWSNRNSTTNTAGSSINSYNNNNEGEKYPAYTMFDMQAIGTSYWARSAYAAYSYYWCSVNHNGSINSNVVYSTYGARVGFRLA